MASTGGAHRSERSLQTPAVLTPAQCGALPRPLPSRGTPTAGTGSPRKGAGNGGAAEAPSREREEDREAGRENEEAGRPTGICEHRTKRRLGADMKKQDTTEHLHLRRASRSGETAGAPGRGVKGRLAPHAGPAPVSRADTQMDAQHRPELGTRKRARGESKGGCPVPTGACVLPRSQRTLKHRKAGKGSSPPRQPEQLSTQEPPTGPPARRGGRLAGPPPPHPRPAAASAEVWRQEPRPSAH